MRSFYWLSILTKIVNSILWKYFKILVKTETRWIQLSQSHLRAKQKSSPSFSVKALLLLMNRPIEKSPSGIGTLAKQTFKVSLGSSKLPVMSILIFQFWKRVEFYGIIFTMRIGILKNFSTLVIIFITLCVGCSNEGRMIG